MPRSAAADTYIDPSAMKRAPLLLCTLVPDVLQAIVRLSCDGMHSEDTATAASAEDTAAALRLTCRTLRATVDGDIKQLTMRATSPEDIDEASRRFHGACARLTPDRPAQQWQLSVWNFAKVQTLASVGAVLQVLKDFA
jgi:hypothetical protein